MQARDLYLTNLGQKPSNLSATNSVVWGNGTSLFYNNDRLGTYAEILTAICGWGLTGNAGTSANVDFVGTTDAVDFVTRTNNIIRWVWTSTGKGYYPKSGTTFAPTGDIQWHDDSSADSPLLMLSNNGGSTVGATWQLKNTDLVWTNTAGGNYLWFDATSTASAAMSVTGAGTFGIPSVYINSNTTSPNAMLAAFAGSSFGLMLLTDDPDPNIANVSFYVNQIFSSPFTIYQQGQTNIRLGVAFSGKEEFDLTTVGGGGALWNMGLNTTTLYLIQTAGAAGGILTIELPNSANIPDGQIVYITSSGSTGANNVVIQTTGGDPITNVFGYTAAPVAIGDKFGFQLNKSSVTVAARGWYRIS